MQDSILNMFSITTVCCRLVSNHKFVIKNVAFFLQATTEGGYDWMCKI